MALTTEDLQAIKQIVDESLIPIKSELTEVKADIKSMKADLALLSKINQLDEIRKNGRLMSLYKEDKEEA